MKQQQLNQFRSKYNLLHSQESSQEIIWSCSDSSDYENTSYKEKNLKPVKRKRKQVKNKKNLSKNISNLDVTIIDGTKGNNRKDTRTSPDCSNVRCFSNVGDKSPILTSSQRHFVPFKRNKSPVINLSCKENKQASPLLIIKPSSQKCSPKVRKKLFDCNNSVDIKITGRKRSVSPVLTCTENILKKSRTLEHQNIDNNITKYINKDKNIDRTSKSNENINQYEKQEIQYSKYEELNSDIIIDDTIKSEALIEKVKSYFDSNFSSTTPSQHSISEYESKSSPKSNDDIEVINSLTDVKNSPNIKLENKSSDSLRSYDDVYVHKTKKVKYKKDGFAYRLNVLLKKQNANTSLWYHERFLAANSNFIRPKEEFMAFRIERVSFKYGCFLLNVLDVNDENCLIFINNLYIKSDSIEKDAVFKLYKPYKILEFNGNRLIINVSKYECIIIKK